MWIGGTRVLSHPAGIAFRSRSRLGGRLPSTPWLCCMAVNSVARRAAALVERRVFECGSLAPSWSARRASPASTRGLVVVMITTILGRDASCAGGAGPHPPRPRPAAAAPPGRRSHRETSRAAAVEREHSAVASSSLSAALGPPVPSAGDAALQYRPARRSAARAAGPGSRLPPRALVVPLYAHVDARLGSAFRTGLPRERTASRSSVRLRHPLPAHRFSSRAAGRGRAERLGAGGRELRSW